MRHHLAILTTALAMAPLLSAMEPAPKLVVDRGELWTEAGGKPVKQLTQSAGKIDGFEVSPSGRYVSAHKIIGETTDHDDTLPDDQQAKVPTYSLLIVDLKSARIVREIRAPEELLHLGEWKPHDVYSFTTGSMLDVVESYEYDAPADQIWRMRFDDGAMDYKRAAPLP